MEPWDPGHGIDRGRCDRGAGVADCPLELRADVRGVRLEVIGPDQDAHSHFWSR